MNQELCLVICFFVGVLIFYLLKKSCGCGAVVEGLECAGTRLSDEATCESLTGAAGPANCPTNYQVDGSGVAKQCWWPRFGHSGVMGCYAKSGTCTQNPRVAAEPVAATVAGGARVDIDSPPISPVSATPIVTVNSESAASISNPETNVVSLPNMNPVGCCASN
jgi:hypothetical protein